ncbi:MAG: aminopeptidase C [Thermoguttaceae bacterium]
MKNLSFRNLAWAAASLLGLLVIPIVAVGDDGSLSPQEVATLQSSFRMDDHTRAMYNAITSIDISQLTLNRDIVRKHNDLFSDKIKTSSVTNQSASGRCWLFAGLNVLRPELVVKHKLGKFELSQSYLAFWDKMEKANCFLEDVIDLADRDTLDRDVQVVLTRAGVDDGWWEYVPALIKKYGVVPQEIMPETHSSSNTAQMNGVLRRKLKVEAVRLRQLKQESKSLAELRAEKARVLAEIYRLLVINLGEPPANFSWRFEDKDSKLSPMKIYTPQSFWREWVGEINFNDYVQLANVPGQDDGKLYQISHSRNIQGAPDVQYLNVKSDVLKAAALKSVLDKQPVWFAADVGKDQDTPRGIMEVGVHDFASIFGDSGKLTKAQNWSYYEGGPTHAMVLMGVDLQENKPVKWLVENSWGKEKGHEGYWSLYDNWFDEHLYMIVVKKAYVPKEILKLYGQMPIVLPRWHPMAQLSD